MTGLPVRKEILSVRRRPQPVLYITGGHQGSLAINQALRPILPSLLKQFTVYHAYGEQAPLAKHNHYRAKKYFESGELNRIYTQARLAVSRAGINTVTELGYLGIPTVLIPLPFTQSGEQETNADYLSQLGLAVVLPQEQLTPSSLLRAIGRVKKLNPSGKFPQSRINQAAPKLFQLCSSLLAPSL